MGEDADIFRAGLFQVSEHILCGAKFRKRRTCHSIPDIKSRGVPGSHSVGQIVDFQVAHRDCWTLDSSTMSKPLKSKTIYAWEIFRKDL